LLEEPNSIAGAGASSASEETETVVAVAPSTVDVSSAIVFKVLSTAHGTINVRSGVSLDTSVVKTIEIGESFEVDQWCKAVYSGKEIRRLKLKDGSGWTSYNGTDGIVIVEQLSGPDIIGSYPTYKVVYEHGIRVRDGLELSSNEIKILSFGMTFEGCGRVVNEEGTTRIQLVDGTGWTSLYSNDGRDQYLEELGTLPLAPRDSLGHLMPFASYIPGPHNPADHSAGWRCMVCSKTSAYVGGYWAAGRYHCEECKADVCIECFVVNRARVPMAFGTGSTANNYYCSRIMESSIIPGSDGQCGNNFY